MRIETREDALREIMQILTDHRQGKSVDFPRFLADLEVFLENDKTVVEELEEQIEELEAEIEELEEQIEELENQEPPITYSDIEAIEEPLYWAEQDLENFRNFMKAVKADIPVDVIETIDSYLNDLEYDINSALDKIRNIVY